MEQVLKQLRRNIFGLPANLPNKFYTPLNATTPKLKETNYYYLQGYQAALENTDADVLGRWLTTVPAEFSGFAAEGIGTGLTLLDYLTPWRRYRLQAFLDGPGAPHLIMVYGGIGFPFAWLHHISWWPFEIIDTPLRWLVINGYGFCMGFSAGDVYVKKQARPISLSGYEHRAFDQGLARSFWFVTETDIEQIAQIINTFLPTRHVDLWRGVGLACALAGGGNQQTIEKLKAVATPYLPQLAQGAANAAMVRHLGHNPAEHTDLACRVLCHMSAADAAKLALAATENLPPDGVNPAFEICLQRIEAHFT